MDAIITHDTIVFPCVKCSTGSNTKDTEGVKALSIAACTHATTKRREERSIQFHSSIFVVNILSRSLMSFQPPLPKDHQNTRRTIRSLHISSLDEDISCRDSVVGCHDPKNHAVLAPVEQNDISL
jgi:hypothetical protein